MDSSFLLECSLYGFFVLACTGIVVYFRKSGNSFKEYTLGGGSVGVLPITLSIIASGISHSTLTLHFEDVYLNGIQYTLVVLADIFTIAVSTGVLIPLFYKLNIVIPYEYCELRFDGKIRAFLTVNYMITQTLIVSSLTYTLAVFMQQVVHVDVYILQIGTVAICTAYSFLGGFKGVVWTDAIQCIIVVGSSIFVLILGYMNSGGLSEIATSFYKSGRFDIDFNLDPTLRINFWTITFGRFFSTFCHTPLLPSYCQRLASLGKKRSAQIANTWQILGQAFLLLLTTALGIQAFARYEHCDPVKAGQVRKYLQLPLYFALDVGKDFKMTQAVVVLGIVSAGISTLSAILNAMPLVIYKDVYLRIKQKQTEESTTFLRMLTIAVGIICCVISLGLDKIGSMREFIMCVSAAKTVNYYIFLVGIFLPFVNAKGARWGAIATFVFILWISIGSRLASIQGRLVYPTKPLYTDQCPFNATIIPYKHSEGDPNLFFLYKITPYCYSLVGFIVMLVVSTVVSYLTRTEPDSNRDLRSLVWPGVHRFLPKYELVRKT